MPDGIGYYIASRGATLGAAGNDVVTAAFYSIHPDFVAFGLDQCRAVTTFEAAAAARDMAASAELLSRTDTARPSALNYLLSRSGM